MRKDSYNYSMKNEKGKARETTGSIRGMYICNTAYILPGRKNIRNADMNELGEITRSFNKIDIKNKW